MLLGCLRDGFVVHVSKQDWCLMVVIFPSVDTGCVWFLAVSGGCDLHNSLTTLQYVKIKQAFWEDGSVGKMLAAQTQGPELGFKRPYKKNGRVDLSLWSQDGEAEMFRFLELTDQAA